MQEQKPENQNEKNMRLAVALTVAMTLIVLFLVIILVIQWAKIGVANSTKRKLDQEIAKNQEILEKGQADLEYYTSDLGQYRLGIEYGLGSGNN